MRASNAPTPWVSFLQRQYDAAYYAMLRPAWAYSGLRVTRYYNDLLQTHGYTPQALAERADDKDHDFYRHLFQGIPLVPNTSVLDVGCGMGHLLEFLRECQARPATYLGLDLVQAFVNRCQQKYSAPYRFECANFITRRFAPDEQYDMIVSLGALVSRVLGYEAYVAACVEKMLRLSRRYVLFNIITEVDRSQGNYQQVDQVGGITYLPRPRLQQILERAARTYGAEFEIIEQRIYSDGTDAFVHMVKPSGK